jgi:glycosyltransferase involved in cell wall biosynthesis
MTTFDNEPPEVCIVGRCDFSTGMGAITVAFAELLSRSFPTCLLPTEPALRSENTITLPTGRVLPVCKTHDGIKASVFADVFWNGSYDYNYGLVPQKGLRVAYPCLDSDAVPARWTELLNTWFDIAAVPSPHLEEVLRRSGVEIPIVNLPLAIDIEGLLAEPKPIPGPKFRIGSIAAFHRRKGTDLLIKAFAQAFGNDPNTELVLHSNLAFTGAVSRVEELIDKLGLSNVTVSVNGLSVQDKNKLLASFDLFANLSLGEGFSIGPREALALGIPAVLSDVGGHRHLRDSPGVFLVEPSSTLPARYPEIDNMIIGFQQAVSVDDAAAALQRARGWALSEEKMKTDHLRKELAAAFSFSRLSAAYAELIKPELAGLRSTRPRSPFASQPKEARQAAARRTNAVGPWSARSGLVVPAHDGGFFSIFNAYFSNLVWELRDDRVHRILPDWDVPRFIERHRGKSVTSFCYGAPSDGNFWTKLFEPMFGMSEEEMNSAAMLYDRAEVVPDVFNTRREPNLTYIHAYKLYSSPWFGRMRREYNRVFREHIKLQPSIQDYVDRFSEKNFKERYMFAAHVRHPGHLIEQPDKAIAHVDHYIDRVKGLAEQQGFKKSGKDWGIFLATDQQRTVDRFVDAFGDRVSYIEEVRRTTAVEDAKFDKLSAEEKNKEGHQVQHIVASDRSMWSTKMAEEVIRDAFILARCNSLLHVTSNISTAVAYMNPDIEMVYCTSGL